MNGERAKPDKLRKLAQRIANAAYSGELYDEFEDTLYRALRRVDRSAEARVYFKGIAFCQMVHRNRKRGIRRWKP